VKYVVTSDRLDVPRGTTVDEGDLSGNIAMLLGPYRRVRF